MNNYKVTNISDVLCEISIQVPPEQVDEKINKMAEIMRPNIELPGFRKGNVSLSHIKSAFRNNILNSVSQAICGEYIQDAVKELNISPVGAPRIMDQEKWLTDIGNGKKIIGKFSFDNSYSVVLYLDVLPKIDPTGYVGMDLVKPNINQDDIKNNKLLALRKQFSQRLPVDRACCLGDCVVIDFVGKIDGVEFEGGSASGHILNELGKAGFIGTFEEQLVGMKKGDEKNVEVVFPAQYRKAELSGKNAVFEVKMLNVIEVKLADVDSDLAMMAGFETVELLHEELDKQVVAEAESKVRNVLDRAIVEKLLQVNVFGAPAPLVEKEAGRIISGVGMKNVPNEALDNIRRAAVFNIKRAMLFDAIYEKEKDIEITPDELDNLLQQHAQANGKTKDEIVSMLQNAGQMDNFVGILRVSKVLDFIISKANKN